MLPSGLAIYKTKLAPHTKGYNYVLGGPHSSFDIWLSQFGNPNHLISSNEDRALKVLESQCKKYYNDDETRDSVITAFQKLIDKGYIMFIDVQ